MALSVQDNILRCLKKFGPKVESSAAARGKWKPPYRTEPKARLTENTKPSSAKDN